MKARQPNSERVEQGDFEQATTEISEPSSRDDIGWNACSNPGTNSGVDVSQVILPRLSASQGEFSESCCFSYIPSPYEAYPHEAYVGWRRKGHEFSGTLVPVNSYGVTRASAQPREVSVPETLIITISDLPGSTTASPKQYQ